jgi:hypothetical protein
MYISLYSLCLGILFILGTVALIILIMVLIKLLKFISRFNGLLERNEKNMDEIMITLPVATKNFLELSDDLRAVGEVITETTATAIETKEQVDDYIDVFKHIIKIIKKVFDK